MGVNGFRRARTQRHPQLGNFSMSRFSNYAAASVSAVFAVAGLLSMTSPAAADAFHYEYLPSEQHCLEYQNVEDPVLHFSGHSCQELTVGGSGGQNCLSHGGWIAIGGRKELVVLCWARKVGRIDQQPVNFHPTKADNRMALTCLSHRQSTGFKDGHITCMATPTLIQQIFDRWPKKSTQRIGDISNSPPECPPNCLKASDRTHDTGPTYPGNPLPDHGGPHGGDIRTTGHQGSHK
jgi:hypothetical protein